MLRFRQMRSLWKFVTVHPSIHNHLNQERHLYLRTNFKLNRTAALAEWRQLGVAEGAASLSLWRLVRIGLTAPPTKHGSESFENTCSYAVGASIDFKPSASVTRAVTPNL